MIRTSTADLLRLRPAAIWEIGHEALVANVCLTRAQGDRNTDPGHPDKCLISVDCFNRTMVRTLRVAFSALCRDTRTMLDISQRQLAASAGVSRAHIAAIESGRVNPSLDLADRIAAVLGLELEFIARPLQVIEPPRQRDLVHARCSGYADRRFRAAGWETRREIEVVQGRWHAWIDLLAFDPRTGTLVIVEIKTRLDDLGAVERQVAWYERSALERAEVLGWRPRRILTWLLLLASDEVDASVRSNREVLAMAFPQRVSAMRAIVSGEPNVNGEPHEGVGRGLALIDPVSRRHDWLMATRTDGRRSAAPYRDYGDAARRLSAT